MDRDATDTGDTGYEELLPHFFIDSSARWAGKPLEPLRSAFGALPWRSLLWLQSVPLHAGLVEVEANRLKFVAGKIGIGPTDLFKTLSANLIDVRLGNCG
jgi:hypothetical protein